MIYRMKICRSQFNIKHHSFKNWYVCILLIMIGLISLRTVWGISIPVHILLVVSVIPAIIGNKSQMIAFAMCCIPFSSAFQYKYALLIYIFFLIVKRRGKIKLNHVMFSVFLMMLWELFHGFYGVFSFVEYLKDFAELLLLVTIVSINIENIDYKLIIRSLAYCTIAVCLVILSFQVKESGWNIFSNITSFRFGIGNANMENYSLSFNPNRLGFMCNLSLCGIFILYNRKECNAFDMVAIVLLVVFGLSTLSRTYVVCLAVILFCFLFSLEGDIQRKLLSVLFIGLLSILVLFVLYNYFPKMMESLIDRFQERDITNGRSVLFDFYNKHIWSSIVFCLFGVGLQDYSQKISSIYNRDITVCHNGYQELWVVWGIVGVLLFLYLMYALIVSVNKKQMKKSFVQYIPMILLLISILAGQFISGEIVLLSLSFIYVCLCIKMKGNMNEYKVFKKIF